MKRSTPSFTSAKIPTRATWTQAFGRIVTSLVLCVALSSAAFAQGIANYTYAGSSGTYTALTGGTSLASGTTAGTDALYTVSLPWNFTYNYRAYNSIWVSSNGFIGFGTQQSTAGQINPISQTSNSGTATNGYDGAISGFGLDLVASTAAGAAPDISYQNLGSTFVVQYTDLARTATSGDRITFQIRLSKTTNVINIVYGACSAAGTSTTSPQVGLRGASYRDWKNLTGATSTAWSAPTSQNTAGTAASTSTVRFTASATNPAAPVSGQTYTWTPPTALGAPTYATLPASENFDGVTGGVWDNGNSVQDLPNANNWRTWPAYGDRSWRKNAASTAAISGWASTTGNTTIASPASGSCASFNQYDATSGAIGYMDYYVDFSPVGTKSLSFAYRANGAVTMKVYLSTDAGATFTLMQTFSTAVSSWTNQTIILGTSTSSTCVVRFEGTGAFGSSTNNQSVDNVSITNAACGAVTPSAATSVLYNGATANWSGGTGTYIIEYGATGFTPGTGATAGTGGTVITAGAGATSAAITGLSANTTYQYYVRQVCSGPTYSSNSTPISFTTPCAPTALPWSEGFEGLSTVGTNLLPSCWTYSNITSTNYSCSATCNSNTAHGGTKFIGGSWSFNVWDYTPGFSLTAGTSYDYSFWYKTADATAGYVVVAAVGTANTPAGMTTTLGTITNAVSSAAYTKVTYTFVAPSSGVYYFGLHDSCPTSAPNGIGFDDFNVQVTPTCVAPTATAATSPTLTGATANWTSSGTGSFIIEYGLPGFTPGTGASAGSGSSSVITAAAGNLSAVISGLSSSTTYQYVVRQDCGAGSYSANSATVNFNTACGPIATFPWSEGFEGVSPTGATNFPNCWSYSNPSGNGGPGTDNNTVVGTTYGGPHAGTKFVYTRYSDTCWIFTPQFTLTAGTTYTFSFWMQNKDLTSPVDFLMSVAYGSTNTPAAMTNSLLSNYSATNSTYQQFTYTFTAASTGNVNFGIKSASPSFTPWYLSFDDFGLVELPNCSGTPTAGTAALNSTGTLCTGSPVTMTLTGYSTQGGIGLQWQSSPAGAGTWSNISGATAASYTDAPTVSTDYRCVVTCSFSSTSKNSNVVSQTVNNPSIASTTGASICGPGTATLTATTASASDTAYWYPTLASTSPIGRGPSFTTPTLSANTTYYVGAMSPPANTSVGPTYSGTSNNTTSTGSHGIMFTTTGPMTIVSAKIPFTGTGTITVAVKDATNTTVISSVTSGTVTGLGTTGLTIPLNLSVPAAGNYTLIVNSITGTVGALGYVGSGLTYPYSTPSGDFTMTSGYWYGSDNTVDMYLFNLVVASSCSGTRVPVAVTYSTPPTITVSPSAPSICNGDSVVVTASGSAYSTLTWTPVGTVNPTTGSVVTLKPTNSTDYVVSGTGAAGGCINSATVHVDVKATPATFTITPGAATICSGSSVKLRPATLLSARDTLTTQNFNSGLAGWTISSAATSPTASNFYIQTTPLTYSTYMTNYSVSTPASPFLMSNSDAGGSGSVTKTAITSITFPTLAYSALKLYYRHAYLYWNTGDTTLVQVSTNGTTWTTVKQYTASSAGSTTTSPVPVTDSVDLSAYVGFNNVQVRFSYRASWGYYWTLDDISVVGTNVIPAYTWTPTGGLYTDAGLTTPYVAGAAADSVYASPSGSQLYRTQATFSTTGCYTTDTTSVTVQPKPTALANNPHTATINNNTTYTLHGSTSNSTSYSWSTTGTGVLSSTSTLTPVYTPAVGENGTIAIILTANAVSPCASAATDTFFLTLNATSNTWKGITSNWFTASNWTSGVVPNSCSAGPVVIPVLNSPFVYPVIVSATAQVNNITVVSGAQVSIGAGQKLGVCGNWVGGTSTLATISGAGAVEFNGTTTQSVSGNNSFTTLTENKTAGTLVFLGTADVYTAMVMTRGNSSVGAAGRVTLKSTATATAYLDNFTSTTAGTWGGGITVERYVPNSTIGYRDISSPVSNAKVSDWAADFTVNGPNAVNCWYAYTPYPTLQYYSESTNSPTTDYYGGFISTTAGANALLPMKGYAARLYTAPLLINTTGVPGNGSLSSAITKTTTSNPAADGWNLMGNPYPSPISWNAVKALNVGKTDGSAYLFQATGEYTGNWATWNGTVGTNGATDQISSTQGFMVLASANNTLVMDNSVRVAATASPFFKTNSVQPDEIRLTLTGAGNSDEIVSYSDANASASYDAGYDAAKIAAGSSVYMSFDMPGKELAINVMNQLTETTELPLKVAVTDAGDYTLAATELNTTGLTAYLKDAQTGTLTNLTTTAPVLHLAGSQYYTGRYSIVFKKSATATGVETVQENQTRIYSFQNKVYITRTNANAADVEVTNLLGQNVANVKSTTEKTEFELPATEPWYAIVKINENGKVTVQKVMISAAK